MENATVKTKIANFEIEIEYEYKFCEWIDDVFEGANLNIIAYKIDGKPAYDFITEVFDCDFLEQLENDLGEYQFAPFSISSSRFY